MQHEMLKTNFHKWIPVYNCPIKKLQQLYKSSDTRLGQAKRSKVQPSHSETSQKIGHQPTKLTTHIEYEKENT